MPDNPINRRAFLSGVTLGSLGLAIGAESITEMTAFGQAKPGQAAASAAPVDDELKGAPVNCAVIGLGQRGREILTSLARMGKFAPIVMICDTFEAPSFKKKALAIAPNATFVTDYRQVLSNPAVKAVFIATPTSKHKQIALDAVQAGKHVYCEAPLANDIAEAKAIAQAGMGAKTIFQPGLQGRCNAQTAHVYHFILSLAAGKLTGGRAQWHQYDKWRQTWPDPAREKELNWRLNTATSSGLLGEVGIHQLDTATWFFRKLPIAVTAYGSIRALNDGRDVADNNQCIVEYPGGLRYLYDASLTTSFDDAYELIFGTDATIMLRDQRGWMFKEPGSNQLGWEVFARKDVMQIGKPENNTGLKIGTGIALVANATKQLALGKDPGSVGTDLSKTQLYQACRAFLDAVRAGKPVPVLDPSDQNPHPPTTPTALEGYQATVLALKANEASLKGTRIELDKELFAL